MSEIDRHAGEKETNRRANVNINNPAPGFLGRAEGFLDQIEEWETWDSDE